MGSYDATLGPPLLWTAYDLAAGGSGTRKIGTILFRFGAEASWRLSRVGLRLALIASLQYLSPKQRAVLLLRDVLEFSADEVAIMLDVTTAWVKSELRHRVGKRGASFLTDSATRASGQVLRVRESRLA